MSSPKLCKICHDSAHGCHFGVPACKACSAFFRRAVARKHNYKCEKDGNCEVISEIRAICKGCRLAKCLAAGMKIASVQTNRDVYGKRNIETLDLEVACSSLERPIAPTLTFLQNITKNYAHLEHIRLIFHNNSGNSMFVEKVPRALNYKEVCKVFFDDSYPVFDWIINSFPDFSMLPNSQQRILFRNLYLQYVILEGGYFSYRNGRIDVRFLSSGDYIDCMDLSTYYYDPDGLQTMSTEEAVRIFASSFDTYKRNVWGPMLWDSVDCFEFIYLVAMVLFDTSLDGITEETIEVCRKTRETIQREILDYYRATRRERDYFVRLGNLLTIVPNLQRATCRFHEDVELSNVLNSYTIDPKFYATCFGNNFGI